jgi:hypothetical protein
MQPSGSARTWEIAVPNGTYNVFVVAGDANAYNSVYRINVEGVLTVSGTPTSANRWISGTKTVTVNDGRLTVSNGSGAKNNKICFIDITQTKAGSSATTPLASSTHPTLQWISRDANDQVRLRLLGSNDEHYQIEVSSDLIHWEVISAKTSKDGGVSFTDKAAAGANQRFYRARLVQ